MDVFASHIVIACHSHNETLY